jgi:hypothetical protein
MLDAHPAASGERPRPRAGPFPVRNKAAPLRMLRKMAPNARESPVRSPQLAAR